ncbi:MAG: hypothetical protein M0Z76_03595 [Gammaproteobacteria bacterium]|nr:hypothetical protein [Gammaproteobacteria bacterium]
MNRLIIAACVPFALCALVPAAQAANFGALPTVSNAQFAHLASDLGNAFSYHDMMPAAPLGITGFDVGVTGSDTHLAYPGAWQAATGSSASQLPAVGLQVEKGLPANFDVGLVYDVAPGTPARVIGGNLSYAISSGGLMAPALTIRGTYTRMTGVSQFHLDTRSVEVSLSKGFAFVTPYVGVGRVRTDASADGLALASARLYNDKVYLGVDVNLGLFNLDAEADRMAGSTYYGLNVGWRL